MTTVSTRAALPSACGWSPDCCRPFPHACGLRVGTMMITAPRAGRGVFEPSTRPRVSDRQASEPVFAARTVRCTHRTDLAAGVSPRSEHAYPDILNTPSTVPIGHHYAAWRRRRRHPSVCRPRGYPTLPRRRPGATPAGLRELHRGSRRPAQALRALSPWDGFLR